MRFKFKVNVFSEEKPKEQAIQKTKVSGKRSDRLIDLKKNFKKSPKNRKAQEEERETRYSDQPGRFEEREPTEDIRRDVTPPRRTSGAVTPRVGSRRDLHPILRKNQPKHAIQQKLSKKVDARLDALREQLGVEFDHEYGAQMQLDQSIDRHAPSVSFDRTRSAPDNRHPQTTNTLSPRQTPFAGKAARTPMAPQSVPSFNGQRRPGNRVSSFTPYARPPSTMLARAQMTPIVHPKPTLPQKGRSPQLVKTRSEKPPAPSGYAFLGAMFSGMCTADSACAKAQSGCTDVRAGCTDMQNECTSAKQCADGSMFDEETLWTKSETLSETQYDGKTICSRTKSYVGEHESDMSDSDFDDESSWDDATSYPSEDETHRHRRKHRVSHKPKGQKQADRPSSRNTRPESARPSSRNTRLQSGRTASGIARLDIARPSSRNRRPESARLSSRNSRPKSAQPSRRNTRSEKHGNNSRRADDEETFTHSSDDDSSYTENRTEVDTYYHGEYDAESQWTDGETYFTKETRRTRRRRDSDSDVTDSEADSRSYSSSYRSEDDDSFDTRTYGDSTWKTNAMDDETYFSHDDTMYTEVRKRSK